MPHIDEGALHAYLDGALDECPAAEAERVRTHLDVCAECRDRLEAERLVRDQAAEILSLAAPRVDVPSFEELRSYVHARGARERPSVGLRRLGFAASVALALATGWLLRGDRAAPVMSADGSVEAAVSGGAPAASTPGGLAQSGGADAPSAETTAEEPSRPTPGAGDGLLPSRTEAAALVVDVGLVDLGPVVRSTPEVATDLDTSPPPLQAPPLDVASTRGTADDATARVASATPGAVTSSVSTDAGGSQPERRSSPSDVVASANAVAPLPGLVPFSRASEFRGTDAGSRDSEEDDEESYSLVVPNLEVLDVRFRGTGVSPEGQVVLQRLEDGGALRIIHLPPEVVPSSLEDLAPGDRQLVVQTSTGWIVMRAPVGEETLRELMGRLLMEH